MEIREGKAHGVFLLNAHGMDVFSVTGRITWKIIGGVLEFYIFVPDDHKPNSVSRAYTDLIGKPMMPGKLSSFIMVCIYIKIDNFCI